MENQDIRLKAKGAGVPLWKVAEYIGISEPTLTRLLRRKVDREMRTRLMTAIREIKDQQGEAN